MTTPTPRTDHIETTSKYPEAFHYYELLEHSRELEQELAAMTEAAKQAVMERDYYQARAKELETLLVKTIKTPPSFPC